MKSDFPHVTFLMSREYLDAEGIWNPRDNEPPLKGSFQVNIFGKREHYLALSDAIRRFAERDTSQDGDYHDHFELMSANGNVRIHLICRKDDVGESTWKDWFPKHENES
jgi:hypothetical protein